MFHGKGNAKIQYTKNGFKYRWAFNVRIVTFIIVTNAGHVCSFVHNGRLPQSRLCHLPTHTTPLPHLRAPPTHTTHSHHPRTPPTHTTHSHHPLTPPTHTTHSHHPLTIHLSYHFLTPPTYTTHSPRPLFFLSIV